MTKAENERKRELQALIAECNAQAENLERQLSRASMEEYLELHRRRTSVILKREVTQRRLTGKVPDGINSIRELSTKNIDAYE